MTDISTHPTFPKHLVTTVSSKGQVTIPVQIRRHLGVGTNDKVTFIIDVQGEVKVTPTKYSNIASLRGAAGSLKKPLSWKKMKEIAHEDRINNKYGK